MHKHKTMLYYCLKYRKNTKNLNLSKKKEAKGLLSSLGIKIPLSKNSFISQCFVLKSSLSNDLIVIITIL